MYSKRRERNRLVAAIRQSGLFAKIPQLTVCTLSSEIGISCVRGNLYLCTQNTSKMQVLKSIFATAAFLLPLCASGSDGLITAAASRAAEGAPAAPEVPADTNRVQDIEEAVIVAQPKETGKLRRQAVSASLFGAHDLEQYGVASIKGITALAPNLYMPDYGSRLTSAVYVRGIGSRINTPAVGLYVDNVPFADKSAYDFDFLDVARVDVLRGPQGTLYGRGAMGGLLRVFTADPLTNYGTTVSLGASARESGRRASATTYLHPSDRLSLSLGAFYKGSEGFRRNTATGKKADAEDAAGGRFRAAWMPSRRFRLDLTASFQYSDERSNPYIYEGPADTDAADDYPELRGSISQNRQSKYRRSIFHSGLHLTYQLPRVTLSSITAYQFLRDRLYMDQDYLRADIFDLEQKQRMQSISEEINVKGKIGKRWEWTSGAFLLYDYKHTSVPVNFYADGVTYLNSTFSAAMPAFIRLAFTDSELPFYATLKTPGTNAALFHQSTFNGLFVKGLSLTLGLRLDYDCHRLTLASPAYAYNYTFAMQMPAYGLNISQPFTADAGFGGRNSHTSWQLLPKVALQYTAAGLGTFYFSVSKGYRSGGFNLENYSDLSQNLLRRNIMQQVSGYSAQTIDGLPMPEASKQAAKRGMTAMIEAQMPDAVAVSDLAYKPEYSWNHEAGTHLLLLDGALQLDAAAFVLSTHNLQMAQMAPSGMGRVIVNAGRSATYGVEAQMRYALLASRLTLSAAYGWAHSTFTKYTLSSETSYKGNHVPYAPEHTAALSADFRQPINKGIFKAFFAGISVQGAGKIYWDEANTFSRPFTAQLNASAGVELGPVSLTLWGKNLTASSYQTFAFNSMSRRFAQYADPLHFGVDIKCHF